MFEMSVDGLTVVNNAEEQGPELKCLSSDAVVPVEDEESGAFGLKDEHVEGDSTTTTSPVDDTTLDGGVASSEQETEGDAAIPDTSLVDKISQLPHETKEVLMVASCLDDDQPITESLLQLIFEFPVEPILKEAVSKEFLLAGYRFANNDVKKAAYSLIPVDGRSLFHVEIGRRLWRKLNEEELDRHIFLLLSQFKLGPLVVTREKEKRALATLCLHAGTKAARTSSFHKAAVYLNLGIEFLDRRSCWRDDYDLALSLYNAAAEMEVCTGNTERADSLLSEVFKYGRTEKDKMQANFTRINSLGISGRKHESIDLGHELLKGLGESLPSRLLIPRLIYEFGCVRWMVRGKSNSELMRLPLCEDEDKLACMKILHFLFVHTLMVRPALTPFVLLKLVKLTLKHGLSVFAATAFAGYGVAILAVVKNIDEAFRFGMLALDLLERFEASEYTARVAGLVYACIWSWKMPIFSCIAPLENASQVGLQTGDIEFASVCHITTILLRFEAGIPLPVLVEAWEPDGEGTLSQRFLLEIWLPTLQMFHHFMGLSSDPLDSKGDILDLDEYERLAVENNSPSYIMAAHYVRMWVAYIFNEYEVAGVYLPLMQKALWMAPPSFEEPALYFMTSLVALELARNRRDCRRHVAYSKRSIKKIKKWARHSPQNLLDRRFLLEAELASLQGQNKLAMEHYLCAISLAKHGGNLQLAARGNELAGRHFLRLGDQDAARPFFDEACFYYEKWGGKAKLDRLRVELEKRECPSEIPG